MGTLNLPNRTLAIMDNYPFLRSINNECIDLIAIDPPFAANETFTDKPKPPISQAEFDEEDSPGASPRRSPQRGHRRNPGGGLLELGRRRLIPQWKMRIQDDYPKVHAVVEAVESCATENEAAYICFMAVRLIECHRSPETHRQHLRPLRRPRQQLPANAAGLHIRPPKFPQFDRMETGTHPRLRPQGFAIQRPQFQFQHRQHPVLPQNAGSIL